MGYVPYAGTTISYQLYRISEWLWNLDIRNSFPSIANFVRQLEHPVNEVENEVRSFLSTKLTRDVSDSDMFYMKQLEKIRDYDIAIMAQLMAFGSDIYNFTSIKGVLFSYHQRKWHYGETTDASSCIIAFPSLSRVLAFETSEDFEKVSQFSEMSLTNVQLYSIFNRLKALRGRTTKVQEKFPQLYELKFLFHLINDIKIIHDSRKLHFLTPTPTIGEESNKFQMATYFAVVGKISGFKRVEEKGMSGIKRVKVTDPTGSIDMNIEDKIILKAHKSSLVEGTSKVFHDEEYIPKKMSISYDGWVLVFGWWALEGVNPWIIHMVPIGNNLDEDELCQFYKTAYVNARKKTNKVITDLLFPTESSNNNYIITDKNWYYITQENLNTEIFFKALALQNEEKKKESLIELLGQNHIQIPLYTSETPEKTFADYFGIPQENVCNECGKELFTLSNFSIRRNIKISGGKLSFEYLGTTRTEKEVGDAVESLKNELDVICLSAEDKKAEEFIQNHLINWKTFFEKNDSLNICKKVSKLFSFMKDIEGNRITLDFSGDDLDTYVKIFLKMENPQRINMNDDGGLLLSKKSCFVHGPVLEDPEKIMQKGLLTHLIGNKIQDLNYKKLQEKFEPLTQKMAQICQEWYSQVVDAIEGDYEIRDGLIEDVKKRWSDIRSSVDEELFSNLDEGDIDVSTLQKIEITDAMFFILCNIVNRIAIKNPADWTKIFQKIDRIKMSLKSNTAMQIGNIEDRDLILKIVAWRYMEYHYKKAIGIEKMFGSDDVIYNSLRQQIERCTYVPMKKNRRRTEPFKLLTNVRFETKEFKILCLLIIHGDISNVYAANSFLSSMTWKKPKIKNWISKTIRPRKKNYDEEEWIPKHKTISRQFAIERLVFRWKELKELKSKTHLPKIYLINKERFEDELRIFLKETGQTYPKFKKLMGEGADSKMLKSFFEKLVESKETNFEKISKIIDEI